MRLTHHTTTLATALAAMLGAYHLGLTAASSHQDPDVIRATEIQIVDASGTVRARLGADLPDAVIDGRVVPRGGKAAGIILYDSDGQERSGYVTMDPGSNVMLTLDSKRAQVGLFAAGPDGGATARLWDEDDAIEMRTDHSGARLTAVKDGSVVFQAPEVTVPDDACEAYGKALESMSSEDVMAVCKQRFDALHCQSCLDRY